MSEVYTGVDGHSINAAFTIPTDGDDLAATSVNDAFQQTADNWAHAVEAYPDTYNGGNYTANHGAVGLGGTWSWSPATGAQAITAAGSASSSALVGILQSGAAPGLVAVQLGTGAAATFSAGSSSTAPAVTVSNAGSGAALNVPVGVANFGGSALNVQTGCTLTVAAFGAATFAANSALTVNTVLNRTAAEAPSGAAAFRINREVQGQSFSAALSGENQEVFILPTGTLVADVAYALQTPVGGVGVTFKIAASGYTNSGGTWAISLTGAFASGSGPTFSHTSVGSTTLTYVAATGLWYVG